MGKRRHGEPVAETSADVLAERLQALRAVFPEVFTEGKVDVEKLRAVLGDVVEERKERYSFSWAGKQDALRLLQVPTRATLVPAPEESVGFDKTSNIFIEGDNLEVLKLLYKPYFGRIKMIYIDPPYNTGNDFIYPDNFADPLDSYLRLTGQKDSDGNLLTSNPETSGRHHSAWLSMIYPRLFLARQLLREDGVIFVSTDDHEVHNLRMVMNEVFGEENWIETFVWKRSYGGGAKEKYAVSQHEYILLYARTKENIPGLWLPPDPEMERRYYKYKDENFETRGPYRLQPLEAAQSLDRRENLTFAIPLPWGGEVWPKRQWLWAKVRVDRALRGESDDALEFTRNGDEITVSYKQYLRDKNGNVRGAKPFSVIDGIYTQQGTADLTTLLGDPPVLQFPKPVALMKRLLSTGTESDQGDTVLDFFAGSCTMAQAVLELNREDGGGRRFVMVQLPEPTSPDSPARTAGYTTIAEIGKERIRRVIQRMKEVDESQLDLSTRSTPEDLGFRAYKLTSSNYKPWMAPGSDGMIPPPESYATQMELLADPLAAGWDPMNVIWEVALKEGYSLNSRIEHVENISGNTVYRLTDPDREQSFLICLDNQLDASSIKELGLGKEDTFICRDVALTDDLAANLALQCRLKSI